MCGGLSLKTGKYYVKTHKIQNKNAVLIILPLKHHL